MEASGFLAITTVAAMAHGPTGDVFNVGGGETVSAIESVRLIERITGRRAEIQYGPPRPGEQMRAVADVGKATRVLGWAPTTGIEAGLRAQVAWHEAAVSREGEHPA